MSPRVLPDPRPVVIAGFVVWCALLGVAGGGAVWWLLRRVG